MNRPILYIALMSLLLVLGVIFFWQPKYRDFTGLRLQVSAKAQELSSKVEYFSRLEDSFARILKFDSEVAKVESALPESQDIPETINFISSVSFTSGLLLQALDIGKTAPLTEDSSILKTEITFSLLGTYSAFKGFLSELQNSARLIAVQEASFKQQGGEATEIFLFNLKVRTQSYQGL
ncbi:MAG: hypothetical protein G01um101430_135 [Parcubacteria group bacterium Gr01-1014_30]|nr:MAG: hypothetical protein G01um101430_135 [Parcubacteria group bacterium Gr01-1014_30]